MNGVINGAISVSIMRIERAIPILPEKTEAQIVPTTAVRIALKRAYPLIIPALSLKKRYAIPTENNGIKNKLPTQYATINFGFFMVLKKFLRLILSALENVRIPKRQLTKGFIQATRWPNKRHKTTPHRSKNNHTFFEYTVNPIHFFGYQKIILT